MRRFRDAGHDRALDVYRGVLHAHKAVPDDESRLCELIEYFGWEKGHRARFTRPWFYWDDPRRKPYEAALGLTQAEFMIMHQYASFNRFDPERPDMYWLFDDIVGRLEKLGGPGELSVLDFGCGLGQIGLAFASLGYRTILSDRIAEFLDFARFLADTRGLSPELHRSETDHTYYDTAADGHPFGLVVEWSAFEHVYDSIAALERITSGLVPGGLFVTTTFAKEWTPEEIAHYVRDTQDEAISEQFLDPATNAWVEERFDVVSHPRSLGKLLVKR